MEENKNDLQMRVLIWRYKIGVFLCRIGFHKWDLVWEKEHYGGDPSVKRLWICRYCEKSKLTDY